VAQATEISSPNRARQSAKLSPNAPTPIANAGVWPPRATDCCSVNPPVASGAADPSARSVSAARLSSS
jgi:hypothetical protein